MASEQDPTNPFALFRLGYSLFSWASLLLTVGICVWLIWTLLVNTPSGTVMRERMLAVGPTLTSVAAGRPTVDPNAPAPVALPATCAGCHALENPPAAGTTCPDLSHIATVAMERMASPGYTGSATTVEEYIRESIHEPAAYIVPDKPEYRLPNGSLMPDNAAVASGASDAELEDLIAYLATLQ